MTHWRVLCRYDTNYGTISFGGQELNPDFLTIAIASYGQLNQEGTISVYNGSQLRVNGTDQAPATLNNDGTINMGGGFATISADVIGSGTIVFLPYSTCRCAPAAQRPGDCRSTDGHGHTRLERLWRVQQCGRQHNRDAGVSGSKQLAVAHRQG